MSGIRIRRRVGRIRAMAGLTSGGGGGTSEPNEVAELVRGPRVRHDPTLDADPSLVVLMPHLSVARMTGGPNTVFQITERLAARGTNVRYVACFGPMDQDPVGLERHIRQITGVERPTSGGFLERSGPGAELSVGRGDTMLATWWPTAHVAQRALASTDADEFIYLIQDFEPGFHPWSTQYAMALSTYRMPFRAIVNEPSLLEHLRRDGDLPIGPDEGDRAISFMPAVDRTTFRARDRHADVRRIVFYARPAHPRNLFELGLRALAEAVRRPVFTDGGWEFIAIGGETRVWRLSDRYLLVPQPKLTYRDYAAYLGESDVLLSLMLSPHTSYPPLEMATAGGLVVTNTFGGKTAATLAAISPAIRGVRPDVESVAAAIVQAAEEVTSGRPIGPPTTLPSSWDESLREVMPWLEATVGSVRTRLPG